MLYLHIFKFNCIKLMLCYNNKIDGLIMISFIITFIYIQTVLENSRLEEEKNQTDGPWE